MQPSPLIIHPELPEVGISISRKEIWPKNYLVICQFFGAIVYKFATVRSSQSAMLRSNIPGKLQKPRFLVAAIYESIVIINVIQAVLAISDDVTGMAV